MVTVMDDSALNAASLVDLQCAKHQSSPSGSFAAGAGSQKAWRGPIFRKLVCLTYRSTKASRRRLHVAASAFEGCQALTIPGGICYLSVRGSQGTQGSISRGGSR